LFEGGDNRILKKIGEESAEFVMACKDDNSEEIAGEAADIVFHLQVALPTTASVGARCSRCWPPAAARPGGTEGRLSLC
jgi:phosphoribosyl-ATP pyrophosphohydrolase